MTAAEQGPVEGQAWAVRSEADGWTPAFPGQRPPFNGPAGNTAALRHGAYSDQVVEPIAQALVAAALEQAAVPGSASSYLLAMEYRPALRAWGVAEARASRFTKALAEHGDCLGCKSCSRWDEDLRRWQATAAQHRQQLGMTPLSRARLGRDVATAQHFDAARVMAELHRQEQERLAAESERADGGPA